MGNACAAGEGKPKLTDEKQTSVYKRALDVEYRLKMAASRQVHCPPCFATCALRQQHAETFQDSHDAMRSLMRQKDQKSVCALVLAIVNEAQLGPDSMTDLSSQAFAGCMDVVNFLLLLFLCGLVSNRPRSHDIRAHRPVLAAWM